MRRLLQRLIDWLRRPVPCEHCGAAGATYVPFQEAYLCDRCLGIPSQ